MRVNVDLELCMLTGNCVAACPEVFEIRDDALVVLHPSPPDGLHEAVRSAAELCPTGAIEVVDD